MILTCVRLAILAACCGPFMFQSGVPKNDPLARYHLAWTREIRWANVVSIDSFRGPSLEARFAAAQKAVAARKGGVVYFPPGVYRFHQSLALQEGVVIRGADPSGVTDARRDGYAPPTRFEFPRYTPRLEGNGTPTDTAFKGIVLADPERAGNCGLVNVAINRGHIDFAAGAAHKAGRNRLVVGCVLRNAAVADPSVPDIAAGQHAWQRYTWGRQAAIRVDADENLLIANNRLPPSGQDNFLMPGYVLKGRSGAAVRVAAGVLFDYDDRPGIVANDDCPGEGESRRPGTRSATPPGTFGKGLVIRDNYVFCTGRTAIAFCGDGAWCAFNVIRFPPGLMRSTTTGLELANGASTNANHAVRMGGWHWTVEGNDYLVYPNLAADTQVPLEDGEGLIGDDSSNIVLESKALNNRGNTAFSLFQTGRIDGLLVQGNTLGSDGHTPAISVVPGRRGGPLPCKNVRILDNTTSGGDIEVAGAPAENNRIAGNHQVGHGGKIVNRAGAQLENNTGYEGETRK